MNSLLDKYVDSRASSISHPGANQVHDALPY
jgi:hypothetical protein